MKPVDEIENERENDYDYKKVHDRQLLVVSYQLSVVAIQTTNN